MSANLSQPLLRMQVTSGDCGIFGAPRPSCRQIKNGTVPASAATRTHLGVDLKADESAVFAAADGKVAFSGFDQPGSARQNATNDQAQAHRFDGNGGLMIFIQHDSQTETRYMHLDSLGVQLGDSVQRGQQIGVSGDTGDAKGGPHLHFEVLLNGTHVDPLPLIAPAGSTFGNALLALAAIGGLLGLGYLVLA